MNEPLDLSLFAGSVIGALQLVIIWKILRAGLCIPVRWNGGITTMHEAPLRRLHVRRSEQLLLYDRSAQCFHQGADVRDNSHGHIVLCSTRYQVNDEPIEVRVSDQARHACVRTVVGVHHVHARVRVVLRTACNREEFGEVLAQPSEAGGITTAYFGQQYGETWLKLCITGDHENGAVHHRAQAQVALLDHLSGIGRIVHHGSAT